MHKPSISILGPGPDVMLIEGFDCTYEYLLDIDNSPSGHVFKLYFQSDEGYLPKSLWPCNWRKESLPYHQAVPCGY